MRSACREATTHKKGISFGNLAVKALLMEVSCTPKPGLVDRSNSGAHRDMDYTTFRKSIAALTVPLLQMEEAGKNHRGGIGELLPELRRLGRAGEERMFWATNNVNTHRGALFTMGILTAAASYQSKQGNKISAEKLYQATAELCEGIVEKELYHLKNEKKDRLSAGERLFLKYGTTGIRGELERGLVSVREAGLPLYEKALSDGLSVNDSLIQALLGLMTRVEDTTVLNRHDAGALQFVRKTAAAALRKGGMRSPEGRKYVREMDEIFIGKNISPGGSADLLAATYFIYECDEFSKSASNGR